MLAQIGVVPDAVVPAHVDERVLKNESPRDHAKRLALAKAARVREAWTGKPAIILAADTVVALGRRILPKADTDDSVRGCLSLLSGRAHQVMTAVAVSKPDASVTYRIATTRVVFDRLTDEAIESYVSCGEGLGKAGGYAIQGMADAFVRQINGSYSSVVGLTLYQTRNLLRGAGCPIS